MDLSDIEASLNKNSSFENSQIRELISSPIELDKFIENMRRFKNETDKKITHLSLSISNEDKMNHLKGLKLENSRLIGDFIISMLNIMLYFLRRALDNDTLDNAFTDPNTNESFSYEKLLMLYEFYLKRYINDLVETYTIVNEKITNTSHVKQAGSIAKLLIYNPELVDYFPKNEQIIENLVQRIIKKSISYTNIFRYDPIEFIRNHIPSEKITSIVIFSLGIRPVAEGSLDITDNYINLALEFLDYLKPTSPVRWHIYMVVIINGLMYNHPDLFNYKTIMRLSKGTLGSLAFILHVVDENSLKALKFLYDINTAADSRKIAKKHLTRLSKYGLVNSQNKYEMAAYNMSRDVLSRSYSYL